MRFSIAVGYDVSMKQVTVFGANGRVGSLVVQRLLTAGYRVIGFVHADRDTPTHPHLRIVEGDVHTLRDIEEALKGSDMVISALGSWGTPSKDIQRVAMAHIIPSMKAQGIRRMISVTGAESRARGDYLSLLHRVSHLAAGIIAGKILSDGEDHITQLEASGLDWAVLRSPIMNENGDSTYKLGLQRPPPWQTIHRHAVADAMVQMLSDRTYAEQAPFITR